MAGDASDVAAGLKAIYDGLQMLPSIYGNCSSDAQ